MFTDGSYHFFPQDVTVTGRPAVETLSARSAPAPLLAAATSPSVPAAPGTGTATVFNELHLMLDAPRMPTEIIVDSTSNGTGGGGVSLAGQTSSRSSESEPASNKGNPLIVTKAGLDSGNGKLTVRGGASQATVWYSDISDYRDGRYQPTPTDSRTPLAVAPRVTVSEINLTTMTAKVNYQFYLDHSAYVVRNRTSGQAVEGYFFTPYARYRSDPSIADDSVSRTFIPDPQGRTLADASLGGTGSNTGNCRGVFASGDLPRTGDTFAVVCFPTGNQNLSATVPIAMVEGAPFTFNYRIRSGFNSDWLVATMSGVRSDPYPFMLLSEFDASGIYRGSNRKESTGFNTYHLLETLRVQIPDVIVSVPIVRPELPLTGGVSDIAYRAAGAGLLAVALVLMGVHVHQRQARHPRRTAHAV